MTPVLSTEEIASIMVKYHGYPVGCELIAINPYGETPDEKVNGWLTGFHGEYGVEFQIIESDGAGAEEPAYQDYNKVQLLLTSLEDISDEDLKQVSRLAGMTEDEINDLDNINPDSKTAWAKDTEDFTYRVADFLRSNRTKNGPYALPHESGQSLFDLGIAVRKIPTVTTK